MRILHLVLWSPSEPYKSFRKASAPLYEKIEGVNTFYYYHDQDVKMPTIEGTLLKIPGKETYDPKTCKAGLQAKTIAAMQHVWDESKYDLLVRSNASTIVHFANFMPLLNMRLNELVYGGPHVLSIGTEMDFVHGTCIVMNRVGVDLLLKHSDELCTEVEDDCAIGRLFRTHHHAAQRVGSQFVFWKPDYVLTHVSAFRHHHFDSDRKEDILNAQRTCHALQTEMALRTASPVRKVFYHHKDVTQKIRDLCVPSAILTDNAFVTDGNNLALDAILGDPCVGQFKILSVLTDTLLFSARTLLVFYLEEDMLFVRV